MYAFIYTSPDIEARFRYIALYQISLKDNQYLSMFPVEKKLEFL